MMQATTVKFKHGNKSDFYITLKERVDQYFVDHNTSKFANWKMLAKMLSFLGVMILTYSMILSGAFVPWQMLILTMIFGLSSAFFVFNVAHDASHGSYSKNPGINKLLTYAWNLVGMSSYIWNLKHNIAHHTYTNICGTDIDIDQGFLLRFHPGAKRKPHHRIQHLYAPILYGLFSIYVILIKDFQMYRVKRFGNKQINRHPLKEYAIVIFSKAFYITYNLVIPYFVLNIAWWQLLIAFVMMHMMIGNVMAFILTPVHVTHGTDFREPDHEGVIDTSWAVH
ncbi:MAG TPA: acyl-CoA desaturase, partial [Flavobacteriales bacterium]|nr:acyl-CoA desaturase [Flavobacteriales bacterium]